MVLYIIYFLTLFILLILFLLFVLSYVIRIEITPISLKVTLFHIPVLKKKNEKLYQWIITMIENAMQKEKIEMEYFSLMDYVHIDQIEILQNVEYRKDIEVLLSSISSFLEEIHIPFQIQTKNQPLNTKIKIQFHIYIGTMLINYLHVKKEIKDGKTTI